MSTESPAERRTRFIAKMLTTGLLWEETADPEAFQVRLDTFVVQVSRTWDQMAEEHDYRVSLFNSSGRLLEELYPGTIDLKLIHELTGHGTTSAFQALYEDARRKALNVDASLDAAMKELDDHIPF